MTDFTVYPAIDLRNGSVVRLRQGDPEKETVYSADPVKTAENFLDAGAKMIHVINLDGAFNNNQAANNKAIKKILKTGAQVQLGGGLRSLDAVKSCMDLGVQRVILSTVAVTDPFIMAQALLEYGSDSVVLGIDVRDGKVYTHGWKEESLFEPVGFAMAFKKAGLSTVITTNIERDGTGQGLNVPAAKKLMKESDLDVIAAGGVDSIKDVKAAKKAGLHGVVIGRALYDGTVDLKEALAC